MGTQLPLPKKEAEPPPIFDPCLLYLTAHVCIKRLYVPLGTELGLSLGDIVLDGEPAPPPLTGHSPQFSASVRYGQTTGWTKIPLGMEVRLGPGDFVFDGDPASPRKKGTAPTQFLAHVYCGQTAGWTKMPLGMEVRLSPGDFVFDRDQAFPRKKEQPHPIFGPYLLWPAARVVLWLDHSDAMCSKASRALCSAGSRFNSSCGPGKARLPM